MTDDETPDMSDPQSNVIAMAKRLAKIDRHQSELARHLQAIRARKQAKVEHHHIRRPRPSA